MLRLSVDERGPASIAEFAAATIRRHTTTTELPGISARIRCTVAREFHSRIGGEREPPHVSGWPEREREVAECAFAAASHATA